MGNAISRQRDRQVEEIELELNVMLVAPNTRFNFTERQRLPTLVSVLRATNRGGALVKFPGEESPKTVYNNAASQVEMLNKILGGGILSPFFQTSISRELEVAE